MRRADGGAHPAPGPDEGVPPVTHPSPEPAGRVRVRVWAPDAGAVVLGLPGGVSGSAGSSTDLGPDTGAGAERTVPMVPEENGWWAAPDPLPHGTDYTFHLDGGPARPDPRSAWQPAGVHGASRTFDTGRHAWTDAGWAGRDVRGAVAYELHVGTFTPAGTLDAAAERLEHLVALGVDVVELLPLAPFNGEHGWGYDGVGLYGVHEPYGGPAALQRFVDAAHAVGIAVCLDVVHNHLGPSGNYLGEFGPYFTDAHSTPWGAAINLDGPGATEVRRWIVDSALRWFRDFHVDALRLDAVHALVDDSERHVLAQLSDEVAALSGALGRPLSLVAETDLNDVVSVTPTDQGGWGMTAQWADDVHHALHALFTGERHGYYGDFGTPATLRHALTQVFVHDGSWSSFRRRPWGRPVPDGTDGHRFVVFASDHDQVGNRAIGDRPSASLDAGSLAAQAALVLLSPFTPMLFMGEEWGASTPWQYFTDHPEPELAEAVREGRRAEFGGHGWAELYGHDIEVPDPQDPATFEASRLDWAELDDTDHARLLDWYRQLTALRRTFPDLASGDLAATDLRYGDVVASAPADPAGEAPGHDGSASDQSDQVGNHSNRGGSDQGGSDQVGSDQGGSDQVERDSAGPEADATESVQPWRGWLALHRGDARVIANLTDDEVTVPIDLPAGAEVRASWSGCRLVSTTDADFPTGIVLPAHGVAVLS